MPIKYFGSDYSPPTLGYLEYSNISSLSYFCFSIFIRIESNNLYIMFYNHVLPISNRLRILLFYSAGEYDLYYYFLNFYNIDAAKSG